MFMDVLGRRRDSTEVVRLLLTWRIPIPNLSILHTMEVLPVLGNFLISRYRAAAKPCMGISGTESKCYFIEVANSRTHLKSMCTILSESGARDSFIIHKDLSPCLC